jgi:hypothetical protein
MLMKITPPTELAPTPDLGEIPRMAERPALWRRVYARLGERGQQMGDLLRALYGDDFTASNRAMLSQWLLGQRPEPTTLRADLCRALDLPDGALDDGARWARTIDLADGRRDVLEL